MRREPHRQPGAQLRARSRALVGLFIATIVIAGCSSTTTDGETRESPSTKPDDTTDSTAESSSTTPDGDTTTPPESQRLARSILSQIEVRAGRMGPAQVSDAFAADNEARDGGAYSVDTGDGTIGFGTAGDVSFAADLAIDFHDYDLMSRQGDVVELMRASGLTEHRVDHISDFADNDEFHTFWDPDETVFCEVIFEVDHGDVDCVTGERHRFVLDVVTPAVRSAFEETTGWNDYAWYAIDYLERRDVEVVGAFVEAGDDGAFFRDLYFVNLGDGWEFVFEDEEIASDDYVFDEEAFCDALGKPEYRRLFQPYAGC